MINFLKYWWWQLKSVDDCDGFADLGIGLCMLLALFIGVASALLWDWAWFMEVVPMIGVLLFSVMKSRK